jgi:hypothetical protein
MSKEEKASRKEIGKDRGVKLQGIALSDTNTFSERMRAIDLLGELGDTAFDELSDIASKGLTYSERMNALDMLEKIIKRT